MHVRDPRTVHEAISRKAGEVPGRLAIRDGQENVEFSDLESLSSKFASYLKQREICAGDRIVLVLEPDIDFVIMFLGALKIGVCVIPISPNLPVPAINAILERAHPCVVFGPYGIINRLKPQSQCIYEVPNRCRWRVLSELPMREIRTDVEDWAYIAFTSGTTGVPKGVPVTHRSMLHSYLGRNEFCPYSQGELVACSVFFIWEIFRPLIFGHPVLIVPQQTIHDATTLPRVLKDEGVTEILFTPSLFSTLLTSREFRVRLANCKDLRRIWLNGEVVTASLRKRALEILPPTTDLLNTYSICECHDVADADLRLPNSVAGVNCKIGKPRKGVTVHFHQTSETSEIGELWISSYGLSSGYLNDLCKTNERFLSIEGRRYFRTGDLAQLSNDGQIELYGRLGQKFRVRGQSVDLLLVEQAILKLPEIGDAIVIVDDTMPDNPQLVAHVVYSDGANVSDDLKQIIRAALLARLPDFMVPTAIIEHNAFPLNPISGKINKKALTQTAYSVTEQMEPQKDLMASNTKNYSQIIQMIWASLLKRPANSISKNENFFEAGGHSLLATELAILIEEALDRRISISEVYQNPTISDLISLLEKRTAKIRVGNHLSDADAMLSFVEKKAWSIKDKQKNSPILLTGATGFLGKHLLSALIKTTDTSSIVYCLVRPHSGKNGGAHLRVQEALFEAGLWEKSFGKRIKVVEGDVSKPHLGLEMSQYIQLAEQVGCVVHCAAQVNLLAEYAAICPSIVVGTRNIIDFCSSNRPKKLHYISSSAIFPEYLGTTFMDDHDISNFGPEILGGYSQAKWVVDRSLQRAIALGCPIGVYRLGNIGHHSTGETSNPDDLQLLILKGCIHSRAVPNDVYWSFEATPVDHIVSAISRNVTKTEMAVGVRTIISDAVSADVLFLNMERLGLVDRRIGLHDWCDAVHESAASVRAENLLVVSRTADTWSRYLEYIPKVNCNWYKSLAHVAHFPREGSQIEYLTGVVARFVR